jgi:hypothetical protein
MTADQTFDRQLAAWVEDATTAPPDDLLDRSLVRVDSTRQRPRWLAGEVALPLRSARTRFVPAWALILIAILAVVLVVAGSNRLILPTSPAVLVDSSPSPSGPPVATTVPSPTTEASPAPSPSPTPLGGGLILAHDRSARAQDRSDVFLLDAGTGARTVLGTLPGYSGVGQPPRYTFERILGGKVVIVSGSYGPNRDVEGITSAGRAFDFRLADEVEAACCPEFGGEGKTIAPAGDLVAMIRVSRFDIPLEVDIVRLDGTVTAQLPVPAAMNWFGLMGWAPDESSVLAYGCRPCNQAQTPTETQTPYHGHLYLLPLDGSGWRELLDADNGQQNGWFFPDGSRLLVGTWPCAEGSYMPRCDPIESPAFISIVDLATGTATKIADTPALTYLALSPDGGHIAYRTGEGMFVMRADGTGSIELDSEQGYGIQWSPDGQWVLFQRGYDIWIAPAAGGSPRLIADEVGGPTW